MGGESRLNAIALKLAFQSLSIIVIFLCSGVSLVLISLESTIVLLIFDFLFVSFIFQLKSSLTMKLLLLGLGNLLGLFWNFILRLINIVGIEYFGELFRIFYALAIPVLNMSWVVMFWSLSLSLLAKPQAFRKVNRNDN